ncbi:MAG: helix-turn-helix transcriptional regulator [Deltaproteobacteria bacterium]|nr:helix-turn-helix transcriptional regulator [Deltaproteobacteria bacterium]
MDLRKNLKSVTFKEEYEKARLQLAIGQATRKIAKQKSLSVRTLAEKMNASPAQVERLFNDKNVTMDTLTKFAIATGKTLSIHFE